MQHIRTATREEVVSHYVASELSGIVHRADEDRAPDAKVLGGLGDRSEGALKHMSRVLLCDLRNHRWLYDQFWSKVDQWALVKLQLGQIEVMPMGGSAAEWHYPKLDRFLQELRQAAHSGERIPHLPDNPSHLLQLRPGLALTRIILIKGKYADRPIEFGIGDGAHRAVALAHKGVNELEAYWGVQRE